MEWRDPDQMPHPVPSVQPTKVLLIGDHPLYQSALRTLVESSPEFRIVAETSSAPTELDRALQSDVDLVLIDFDLTSNVGQSLANFENVLQRIAPRPVIVLSSDLESDACHTALRLGVSGIVLKSRGGNSLIDAMESAKRGQVWLERAVLTQMFAESSHTRSIPCAEQEKIKQLTPREIEIVQVACTGKTNKQIAERLVISEATVRHHLGSVFSKLGVASRSELVVYGYRHNLARIKDQA